MPRLHGYRDPDPLGTQLALHERYLRREITYDELCRSCDSITWRLGPVIIPLRPGNEPEAPRDWPTAIVTRWSGKR